MPIPPYLFLWLLGILMVAFSWYIPDAGGFFWLGALTLLFGMALALYRRRR